MAKILLFGASTVVAVPSEIISWLQEYNKQGHEFIVSDTKGASTAFHKALSSIGANKVTVYCMDTVHNNLFEFPVKKFITLYNSDDKQVTICSEDNTTVPFTIDDVDKEIDIASNRQWYEYRDKMLINDCDIAIGIYDGDSKKILHMIQLLNIQNKPCYTFTVEV